MTMVQACRFAGCDVVNTNARSCPQKIILSAETPLRASGHKRGGSDHAAIGKRLATHIHIPRRFRLPIDDRTPMRLR